MDHRRTFESPMDWEYQDSGPMDPSSPFARSAKQSQQKQKNSFASSNFNTFGHNRPGQAPSIFQRTNSTPSKPLPPTPGPPAATNSVPSFFPGGSFSRTTTAPPFRNPAFTTPRKAFDADVLSEVSGAEDSPAATDASDFPETPDRDVDDFGRMTVTPASMAHHRSPYKKTSGKGEIAIFASRDKVRKRRRNNGDKDISGYRLPYRYGEEQDGTDYDSDDSTAGRPSSSASTAAAKKGKGFFGHLFSMIQKHPHVPQILGFWLTFVFHLVVLGITFSIMWMVWSGLREDFFAARRAARDAVVNEMDKCRADYMENKCAPKEQRLPAMFQLCEQWFECFSQDPNRIKNIQIGAKGIVEILNEIVDAMHWKTMIAFIALAGMFFFSGRSLINNTTGYANFAAPVPPPRPYASHPASMGHPMVMSPQGIAWEQIPQTPRHLHSRHLLNNDETPETDASPSPYKALPAPQTPSTRRSPVKGDRMRSPTKSRSPTKRYRD
ncbi:Di-sulfide bridge nucleocytoplasmic transport domain-domain-containing protein [Microdochium bolleyi]|uniref:Di-sulfide bridge nucleocytoplasmic transport domain-domain-containing protein n=1 Tax=Microdochium bolleyi TaxID=196109 RepID=A0A136IX68_9PEZI|nr:Di-sulfide bridge nucleocytoplasmic transport domain-domain-containing protein [Microdochium bolleyi]